MSCYFTEKDWRSATPPCSGSDMSPELVSMLHSVRSLCGFPLVINSAYRTTDYELSKGRSGTSSHCKGLAVDIACKDEAQRLALLAALIRVGFVRIGISKTFIHCDIDREKKSNIWLY